MKKRICSFLLLVCLLLNATVPASASTTFDLLLEEYPNRYLETETEPETTKEEAAPAVVTTAAPAKEETSHAEASAGGSSEETKGTEEPKEPSLPSETISESSAKEITSADDKNASETTTAEEETTHGQYTVTFNGPNGHVERSGPNYLKPFLSYLMEQFGEDAHLLPGAVTVSLGKEDPEKPHYLLACSVITPTPGSVNASTSAIVLLCDLYNKLRTKEDLNVNYSLAFTFDSEVIEKSPYILSLTKEDYDGVILFDNLLSCERLCLYKCNTAKDDPLYLALRAAFLNNGTPLFEVPELAYEKGFKEPLAEAALPVVMIESAMILNQLGDGSYQYSNPVKSDPYQFEDWYHRGSSFTRRFQSDNKDFRDTYGEIFGTVYDTETYLQKNLMEIFPVHAKNIFESLLRVSPKEPMPVKEKPTIDPSASTQEEGPTFFAPTTEEETTAEEATTLAPTTESVKEEKSGMPFTRSFLFFILLLFAVFAIALYLFRIRFMLLRKRKTKFDEEEDAEDTKSK